MSFEKGAILKLLGLKRSTEYNDMHCIILGPHILKRGRYPVRVLKTGKEVCVRTENLRFLDTDFHSVIQKLHDLYLTESSQPDFVLKGINKHKNVLKEASYNKIWKILPTKPGAPSGLGYRVDRDDFGGTWNDYRQACFSCCCYEFNLYLRLLYSLIRPKYFRGQSILAIEALFKKRFKLPPEYNVRLVLPNTRGLALLNTPRITTHIWLRITLKDETTWHVDPTAQQYGIHRTPFYVDVKPIPGCESYIVDIPDSVLRDPDIIPVLWASCFQLQNMSPSLSLEKVLKAFELKP